MGDNLPGVHNKHMSLKAKMRTFESAALALTSSQTHITSAASFLGCDTERNIAIVSIKLKWITAPTSGAQVTDFKVGIDSDDDAICSAQSTSGTNAQHDVSELTMNSTLRRSGSNPNGHRGLPVIPAGTGRFLSYTGVSNAGTVRMIVSYIPLDD